MRFIKRNTLFLFCVFSVCFILSCGQEYMSYLPHPTRAMIIGSGEDCYVGETVHTEQYAIRYTSSGIYAGSNSEYKKTKTRKFIYIEYEAQKLKDSNRLIEAGDFYVEIEGEKHQGITIESEKSAEEASLNQKRRRVYFEVPLRTDSLRICFKDNEESQDIYYFLFEGNFSIDMIK